MIYPEIDPSGMADFPFRDSNELSLQDCYLTAHCWSPKAEPFGFASELSPEEVLVSDFGAGCSCIVRQLLRLESCRLENRSGGRMASAGTIAGPNCRCESSFFFSTLFMPGLGDHPVFCSWV